MIIWKKVFHLIVFLSILSFSHIGFAGNSATIKVSATVLARISQSVIHQVSKISITESDIKNGFIEISSALVLQVQTNSKGGYFLILEGESNLFKEVLVTDHRGKTVVLSPTGGHIPQPYTGSSLTQNELTFKFKLRQDIEPGLYPFPYKVRASLL